MPRGAHSIGISERQVSCHDCTFRGKQIIRSRKAAGSKEASVNGEVRNDESHSCSGFLRTSGVTAKPAELENHSLLSHTSRSPKLRQFLPFDSELFDVHYLMQLIAIATRNEQERSIDIAHGAVPTNSL